MLTQAQKTAQDSCAAEQPHHPVLHGSPETQPHRINSKISKGAGLVPAGVVTGINDFDVSSFCHPYSVGYRLGGSAFRACFQMQTWICARFTFSSNASDVGGSAFSSGTRVTVLFPVFENYNLYLASERLPSNP